MAYSNNYYYPMGYQSAANQPMMQPQPQNNQFTNSINWVQGEAGAKSYPVAAGNSVQLMDTEESIFYIKTVDQSGMPQPLRIFDYTERTSQNHTSAAVTNTTNQVTREEFEELKNDVKRLSKGIHKTKSEDDD